MTNLELITKARQEPVLLDSYTMEWVELARTLADALEQAEEDAALGRVVREEMERGLAARERGEMKPLRQEWKRQWVPRSLTLPSQSVRS